MRVLVSEKLSQHKYKTPEGYLICTDAILARTGKQQYLHDEVFHDGSDETIDLDRPYSEVFNEKTLASFENKPITIEHPQEDVNVGNYKDYSVGYVRDVRQGKVDETDVIIGNLVITDQEAIDEVESGNMTDLSCGYDCDVVGIGNDYKQVNIRGNHVALCKEGRAGCARIIDSIKDDAIENAVKRGKLTNHFYSGKYGMKGKRSEFEQLKKEIERRGYRNVQFESNPYISYNIFFEDSLENDVLHAIDNHARYISINSMKEFNEVKRIADSKGVKIMYNDDTGKAMFVYDSNIHDAYEALWYTDKSMKGDYQTKEFASKQQMLNFYNQHKNDADKFGWWLTRRDRDWNVVEDIDVDDSIHDDRLDAFEQTLKSLGIRAVSKVQNNLHESNGKIIITAPYEKQIYAWSKKFDKAGIKYERILQPGNYTLIIHDSVIKDDLGTVEQYMKSHNLDWQEISIWYNDREHMRLNEMQKLRNKRVYAVNEDKLEGCITLFVEDSNMNMIVLFNVRQKMYVKGNGLVANSKEASRFTEEAADEFMRNHPSYAYKKIYENELYDSDFIDNAKDSKINDKLDRPLEVYKLCKENNWFTRGYTEDYEYMLNHCDVWNTEKIADVIAKYSRQSYSEIYAKLKVKIGDSIHDINFKYLTESEKELKEALGLYKRIEGSHAKASTNNSEKKHRQNQFNNPQVAELNEAINEAIHNLDNGVKDKSAWQRLSMKVEAWESDPEYAVVAKKAKAAIQKFMTYIAKDSMSAADALSIVNMIKKISAKE